MTLALGSRKLHTNMRSELKTHSRNVDSNILHTYKNGMILRTTSRSKSANSALAEFITLFCIAQIAQIVPRRFVLYKNERNYQVLPICFCWVHVAVLCTFVGPSGGPICTVEGRSAFSKASPPSSKRTRTCLSRSRI